jgi:hypothetical protein
MSVARVPLTEVNGNEGGRCLAFEYADKKKFHLYTIIAVGFSRREGGNCLAFEYADKKIFIYAPSLPSALADGKVEIG